MSNLTSLFVYVSIGAITPGPNNITCMNNGMRMGVRKSLGYNFGVFAGYFIINTLCVVFGSAIYKIFPSLKPYILAAGTAYLLWMAYKVTKSTSHGNDVENVPHTFWSSFFFQFMNPKAVFYSLTAAAVFITPYYQTLEILLLLSFMNSFIGFAATLIWSVFGSIFQKFFIAHSKLTNIVMALLLVYCAFSLYL